MKKKIIASLILASALYASPAKAMVIPSHSIVIGNNAYSLDYILKPANYGEINRMMSSVSSVYYIVNSSTVKDLFTNNYVSPNLIDNISTIYYKDENGEQYTAKAGDNQLTHVNNPFMAEAKVEIGSGYSIAKRVTITNCTVPGCKYFRLDGSSYIRSVGNSIATTISDNSVKVYFYSDSSGENLVAQGTINVANSSGSNDVVVSDLQYALGNTSGNINNFGITASDDQWIYYRGTGGDLYKVKKDGVDRTQLTVGHDVKYINVVGDYIYYVHTTLAAKTTSEMTAVYRMRKDGSDAVKVTSGKTSSTTGNIVFNSANQMSDVIVVGNWIYYIDNVDKKIHRASVDGYSNSAITSNQYTDINVVKNNIYAVNISDDYKIYRLDISNGFSQSKVSDVQVRHLNVVGDWMYYRNYVDNEKLYRMSTDGIQNIKLCDDMVYNVNVSGDSVYYKNHSDGDKLYKIGADGTGGQLVLSPVSLNKGVKLSNDVVEYINVVDNTVYYSPIQLNATYAIQKDGTGKTQMK